jgi:hypothetical protein
LAVVVPELNAFPLFQTLPELNWECTLQLSGFFIGLLSVSDPKIQFVAVCGGSGDIFKEKPCYVDGPVSVCAAPRHAKIKDGPEIDDEPRGQAAGQICEQVKARSYQRID